MKGPRERALNFLARREYSSHELTQKLMAKGYSKDEVAELIADLKAQKLLSDERFIEAYINRRKAAGFGPQRIRVELQSHQLNDDLIMPYLNSKEHDWQQLLKKEWRKKFLRDGEIVEKDWRKQAQFLLRRGFESFSIRELQTKTKSLEEI